MLRKAFQLFSLNRSGFLLILLGTFAWSLTMIKNGLIYSFGMGFWGANGHDGVWHIALIKSLARGSFEMPTFANETLKNYHIGFDLLLAFLHKVTFVPVETLYFQIIPPILAFLIGILTYKFVFLWTKTKLSAFWSVFFVYFSGSFGWIVTFIRSGEIAGESMFWASQAPSTLINPSYGLSLVFILVGLISLQNFLRTLSKVSFLLTVFIFGALVQIKIYASVLILAALFFISLFQFIRFNTWQFFKIFFCTLLISFILYLPLLRESGNLLVFYPFWFLETMMLLPDRVGWQKFFSAMTTYRYGDIWFKAIPTYLVAFAIFWVGNMGIRIIKEVSVVSWVLNFRKLTWTKLFVLSVIILGGIIPMFLLQKGTPWNTIQFFHYSLFFSGILAGLSISEIEKFGKKFSIFVKILIIILAIPSTYAILRHYLPEDAPSIISNKELAALRFLAKEPNGIVLTVPFQRGKSQNIKAYIPLYLYESTSYVSAFANKPTYLEDEVNLEITAYDWKLRKDKAQNFYNTSDIQPARKFLKEAKIDYIYSIQGQTPRLGESELGLTKIFENEEVKIFKVSL